MSTNLFWCGELKRIQTERHPFNSALEVIGMTIFL